MNEEPHDRTRRYQWKINGRTMEINYDISCYDDKQWSDGERYLVDGVSVGMKAFEMFLLLDKQVKSEGEKR